MSKTLLKWACAVVAAFALTACESWEIFKDKVEPAVEQFEVDAKNEVADEVEKKAQELKAE